MEIKLPTYFKYTVILLGLILLVWILQTFQGILIPLAYAALFALLLLPMVRRLEKLRIPTPIAIIICLIVALLLLSLVVWFISSQIMSFTKELSDIAVKLKQLIEDIQLFLQENLGLKPTNREDLINNTIGNLQEKGTMYVSRTISITTGVLTLVTIIPIFIFCFLYYRDHIQEFLFRFISKDKRGSAMHTLENIQKVAQSYISGLMIVILIVAMLNSIGLMVIGLEHAIFFGVFASILTIIPYVGIAIGATLPALYALITRGSVVDMTIIVLIFAFVQFLEGNFITPYITGSKVRINPFAAILALIIGGEIWGAAGMIISIPTIAILKVLFDAYPPLEPFGFLLCDIDQLKPKPSIFSKLKEKFNHKK